MILLRLIGYIPEDLPFATLGTILIFIFLGYLILRKKSKKKRRKRKPEVLFYRKDVLGQPIPVYEDKSESYKPIGISAIGLRVFLFVGMAFLSLFLVFKESESLEPISGTYSDHNDWSDNGPFFEETKINGYYKLYLDPMFPVDYMIIYRQPNSFNTGIDFSFNNLDIKPIRFDSTNSTQSMQN